MKDFKISKNFNFHEATHTNNKLLLQKNREVGIFKLPKISLTINLLAEPIRHHVLGDTPLEVHSMFRCYNLNDATKGSSSTSQHPKGEAMDWSRWGQESYEACKSDWMTTRNYFEENKVMFGQLIFEEANRGYAKAYWIHVSLGAPFRDINRCGQVLTMCDGRYEMIERLPVEEWW